MCTFCLTLYCFASFCTLLHQSLLRHAGHLYIYIIPIKTPINKHHTRNLYISNYKIHLTIWIRPPQNFSGAMFFWDLDGSRREHRPGRRRPRTAQAQTRRRGRGGGQQRKHSWKQQDTERGRSVGLDLDKGGSWEFHEGSCARSCEESQQQWVALCKTWWEKPCQPLSRLEYHRSKKPNARWSEFVSPCQSTCEWVPWPKDGMRRTILGPLRRWTYQLQKPPELGRLLSSPCDFSAGSKDDVWVNSGPVGFFICAKVKCYWDTWQNRAVLVKLWQKVVSSHGDPPFWELVILYSLQ